jgi:hypothetical protein
VDMSTAPVLRILLGPCPLCRLYTDPARVEEYTTLRPQEGIEDTNCGRSL